VKKTKSAIITICLLCLLLGTAVFAWYKNNRETAISGEDNILIKGSGVLVMSYATNNKGKEISASEGEYVGSTTMKLSGRYADVSGDGVNVYVPKLGSDGLPVSGQWTVANEDVASVASDLGQYVTAELYFKSDSPMDIYLSEDSKVYPVSKSKDGENDLTNSGDYSGYAYYSDFSSIGGMPTLNVNQSSYGLFSRNLIAGAVRVAVSESSYDSATESWSEITNADVIWVPNSSYQLVKNTGNSIYRFYTSGAKESTYSYFGYENDGATEKTVTVKRSAQGKLIGVLYIKKTAESEWEQVTNVTLNNNLLVPARTVSGMIYPIPQMWFVDDYADAAYSKDLECFVKAEYDSTNNLTTGFAYVLNDDTYVKKTDEGYVEVEKNGSGAWEETTTEFTSEEDIQELEEKLIKSSAEYHATYWMDDSDFTVDTPDGTMLSTYKIGTTSSIDDSGNYYAKVKVAVWVEGYDRESNIALNAGEFKLDLRFYGVDKSE